ncbi:ATP-binding protein [Herbidospora yilanensis]|uniref:ATP-binding protein n=1 Tax=Herbidospora yilanensis TaxID=354426 RepID=UPI0012FA48C5|nr:NB-ARC domain-containing protein [Herbidospora yilanensis]
MNLPAETSTFVGRDAELSEVGRLITESSVVTLAGPGGVGKTRLAFRAAAQHARVHLEPVRVAELAAERNGDLLAHAVSAALGLPEQSVRPQGEVLAAHLADSRMLIVLDTVEHLVGPARALVGQVLAKAPGVRFLVTGRQPLGHPAERVYRVRPLVETDALRLFAERAAAVVPGFTSTEEAAQLCHQMEGLPLAIELAARRLRSMTPKELADRLDDRFALLSGHPGRTGRHTALRTSVGWSHELCTPDERLLWARLSVFAGSFETEAAQYVCGDDRLPNVPGTLARLADKSVVCSIGDRFHMLETVRVYGREWLRELGEEEHLMLRHRDHYVSLARRAEADWCGPNQASWSDWARGEMPNLRLALDRSIASPIGLDLVGRLWFVWYCLGHAREGRHYLDRALERNTADSPQRTRALWAAAFVAFAQGDRDQMAIRLTQAREAALAQDDPAAIGHACTGAAGLALFQGDFDAVRLLAEEAIDHLDRVGGRYVARLSAMALLALALIGRGDPDEAVIVLEGQRAACEALGEEWSRSMGDQIRAAAELGRGDAATADRYARTSLRTIWRLGDVMGGAMAVERLAACAVAMGDAVRAARLLGVGERLWAELGSAHFAPPGFVESRGRTERRARRVLGERDYLDAYAEGRRLSLDGGVGYALGGLPNSGAMRWNHPADECR